jgi:MFS family permease
VKRRTRFFLLYSIGFFASVGATLLQLAFFYYTVNRWGWSAKQNLALATIQGAIYTASALFASAISARFGRRKSLAGIYSIMTVCALLMYFTSSHAWVCCWLLVYILFTALNWPMLESLCSESTDAHELSQHIGIYNITWAVAGAVAMFGAGTLIEHFSGGLFLAPVILHGSTVLILFVLLGAPGESSANRPIHAQACWR